MFTALGYRLESFFIEWGRISYLGTKIVAKFFLGRFKFGLIVDQMMHLGIRSLGITS